MEANSEALYRTLFEATTDGVVILDEEGRCVQVNESFARLVKTPRERLIGASLQEFIPPERRDHASSDLRARLSGEFPLQARDGSLVELEWTSGDPFLPGLRFFVAREIGRRKAAERELQRQHAELEDFVENATIGLHWVGPDGTILWANRAELELLGYTREEYIGHPIAEFHADPPVIEDILQRLARKEELHSYEARLRCKDGSIRHVLLSSNVRWDGDRFVHTRCFSRDITARKLAEEDADRHRQWLKTTLASIGDTVIVTDERGRVTFMNGVAEGLTGWPEAEAQSRGLPEVFRIVNEATRQPVTNPVERVRETGHVVGLANQTVLIARDGKEYVIDDSAAPIRNEAGELVGMVLIFRDISDKRRLEIAAHRLAAIVASSDDAIVGKDLNGIVTSWNQGAERIFGYTAEEMIGQSITRIIPPERPDEEPAILARLRKGERIDHFETVRVRKDGARIHVSVTISPIRDDEGRIVGASKVARDITDRIEREEALHQESLTIRTINQIGQSLLSELDEEKLVQSLTDAATALVGAQFGSFFYNVVNEKGESYLLYTLSGAPREAFARFPMPRNTAVFAPTFRGEGIVRAEDITKDARYGLSPPYHGMPEGHLPVRSYLAAPVVSRSGEVLGGLFFGHASVGVFTERHEQLLQGVAAQAAIALDNAHLYRQARQAREEAETASRLKDEFLATVSHELRTPLNAIMGYTQLLQQPHRPPELVAKGLATIERNVKVQAQLINDLLDVSRIISGKLRLDVQPVDLAAVIHAAIDAVLPAADAKEIRIQRILDPLAARVTGDPNRLQQVVWNLLSNAIKYTPKGGRVQVLLERVNSHLEITVSDTGQGIAPDFLPHVFERFRQIDSSTTRRHGGLGLGLAIVRHLVELHGGTVRAKSPGEGQGSTFIVMLPLPIVQEHTDTAGRVHPLAEPPHRPADVEPLECPPPLKELRVLIVDDEADARDLMKSILEECDAVVEAVPTAEAALAALGAFRPDVLLSDIGMPETDGYELIRRVRTLPPDEGGDVPAAALTAYARPEDRRRALLFGFQAHLPKPIERDDLLTIVASLAGRTGR